jgi:hypothetical protein
MIKGQAIESDPRLRRMYENMEERRRALEGQQRELAQQECQQAARIKSGPRAWWCTSE